MTSCLDDSDDVYFHEHKQSILLLQVDYTNYEFEQGTELFLHAEYSDADTIPIGADYDSPGDFGNISLFYEPGNELIFDGSIVWNGTGHLKFQDGSIIPHSLPPWIFRLKNLPMMNFKSFSRKKELNIHLIPFGMQLIIYQLYPDILRVVKRLVFSDTHPVLVLEIQTNGTGM